MIKLWDHQEKYGAALMAGEITALWFAMRTGKTLTAIRGTDDGDRLIICPNSVKGVWQEDLQRYDQDSYIWNARNKKPKSRPRNVIINFESVWRTPLLGYNFDSIIIDESHRASSWVTKLWEEGFQKYYREIAGCKRVICLSGSPCAEGSYQMVTQSIIMTGHYFGEYDPHSALRKYYTYDEGRRKWVPDAGHQTQVKALIKDLGPTLTQKQAGINTKKVYRTIRVPLGRAELRLWDAIDKNTLPMVLAMHAQSVASGRPIEGATISSAKLNAVAEYASDALGQVVILVRFTASLVYLKMLLPRAICVYGEDGGGDFRTQTIKEFDSGSAKIMIAQIATVKVGLNLSAASTLIFAENSFSGEARLQAEERATVKGKHAVEIVDFISVGTDMPGVIDEHVLTVVRSKKDFNGKMLNTNRR